MSDSDYGSDDELFDDVDLDALESPVKQVAKTPNKRSATFDSDDEFSESDVTLFDGAEIDEILSASQQQLSPGNAKRVKLDPAEDQKYIELARRLLQEKFGYPAFRHEQEKAIACILRGENALVIFPTGAGKSLCYQIPAIAFEEVDKERGDKRPQGSGLTIVVSPLIALMKDQTDALKGKGIAADCSDSTKTYEEHQQIHAAIHSGRLRLLYVSPEKLNNEGFVASMKHVPGGIRLVAVDEAHCISEWGHSFRPDYLKVARFVQEIKAERVICLTATATPRVADDVRKAFSVQKTDEFRTSPYRPNLYLEAAITVSKLDKFPRIFRFLEHHPGPTIIYVTLQKQSEELAKALLDRGFDAAYYHAGMTVANKTGVQDLFMKSGVRIVVATIAFGMGIDKADIRNVIHWDISSTVEEYSQQIGRAGRDGLPSNCVLYLCNDDFYIRENFARGDLPSRQSLLMMLKDIFSRGLIRDHEGEVLKVSHSSLSSEYDIRATPLSILFATLELRFGLMRAITPEYNKYEFEDKGSYHRIVGNDNSPQARAIYANATKAKKWYNLDIKAATASTGLNRVDVLNKLNNWHDRGVIVLKASGVEHRYRVLRPLPASDEEIQDMAEDLYADMETREADAIDRTQQVANLITGSKCFALALAEHFGMELPDGKAVCGHCTYCSTKKALVLPPKQVPAVNFDGIKKILAACDVRDDPRLLARVAFGITSPRITKLGLSRNPVFMSLADHEFKSLLREFENACKSAKHGPLDTSTPARSPSSARKHSHVTPRKGSGGSTGYGASPRKGSGSYSKSPNTRSYGSGSGSKSRGSGSRSNESQSKTYGSGSKSYTYKTSPKGGNDSGSWTGYHY